jgi:hypothetical protein
MIIIKHRINTLEKIKKTSNEYGVEIDLRSSNNKIYLNHDPFKRGVIFEKWIKLFNHKILVLNVKEEGLEKFIIKILKKYRINNYFFHDQSFSSMLLTKNSLPVSIRFSEFEDIKKLKQISKKIRWVWVDHFTSFPLIKKKFSEFKRYKMRICIVSPELVKKSWRYKIKNLKKTMRQNQINVDAVCTKHPKLWK